MVTGQDLTFVSTDDLITELGKRNDAMVFLGMRFTSVDGKYEIKRIHHGHRYICLGMLSNVESVINDIENNNLRAPSNG